MRLKSRGGGHVNFHVASRGVAINFDFPAGVGSCLNCSNKIIKKNSSLASLAGVLLINVLYLVKQANKFLNFYFCKCKCYFILVFLLL